MKEEILRVTEQVKKRLGFQLYCKKSSSFRIEKTEEEIESEILFLQTCLKALREQLDRLEGCWLCEKLLQSEFNFHEQKHSIQIVHGKVRIRFGNKEITAFKTIYCPYCGRKLRGGEDES